MGELSDRLIAELIEAVRIPLPHRPPTRQWFRKVGTRAAQAISKTVAAGLLWLKRDGTVEELRFALGSGRRGTVYLIERGCAGGRVARRKGHLADRRRPLDGRIPPGRLQEPPAAFPGRGQVLNSRIFPSGTCTAGRSLKNAPQFKT